MALFTKKYSEPGSAPGEALLSTQDGDESATLSIMDFSEQQLTDETDVDMAVVKRCLASPDITWLHVQGRPSPRVLKSLGEVYGLHMLALEDVLKAGQRSKAENY
jgi:magnesium transporter